MMSGEDWFPCEGRRVGVSVRVYECVVYVVPPFRRPKVCGLRVPRWMVFSGVVSGEKEVRREECVGL